ncbi:MAG: dependent oxidoreductase [Gemmatimonadetes bacterium]|nr:dependent oxidoreductase [Gemmatimonadota bacterium]
MDLRSGSPFWPVKDGLLHAHPPLDADVVCEVAVIGAGITGALIAYHLGQAGVDTIVLDKRDVAHGSTAASTALLQYELNVMLSELADKFGPRDASNVYLACRRAVERLGEIATELRADIGYERRTSLYLATSPRDVKLFRTEWELRRTLGFDLDLLGERDIAQRFSFARPAALLTHNAAQVDPYAFAHALLDAATRRDVRVYDRTDVVKMETTNIGMTLRTAAGCTVRARSVVFAQGYEAHSLIRKKVARLVSTYAVVSEPVTSFNGWGEDRCLIWEHARPYLYLRTTPDGRIIVGGEDEAISDPKRRDRRIEKKTRTLTSRFRELFPAIAFDVAYSWAGTFGEIRDGLAYIGRHMEWPHAYFALGYGGNGITFSVLAAEIIRDAVLGRPNDDAYLFRFDR